MKKLLNLYDNYILTLGVSFLFLFIALYPKLPSVHIVHTWVYIRLEDFFILAVSIIYLIQLLRRKVKIPLYYALPIAFYWLIGLVSLVFSLLFIGPNLPNFFPSIAVLEYLRRIEYMVLFFIGFSSILSLESINKYSVVLGVTLVLTSLYGILQKFYYLLWNAFPSFFTKFPFCFPAFQTGNEEFAKGIPLCLTPADRISSTFAGTYDLAAYFVILIPIFVALMLANKKWWVKILLFLVSLLSLTALILTASRISFIAYLVAVCITLIWQKKKLAIIPVIAFSIVLLFVFSGSTAKRFLATIQVTSVITNSNGQIISTSINQAPIKKNKKKAVSELPSGSGYLGLPLGKSKTKISSTSATGTSLTPAQLRALELQNGVNISNIQGQFSIQKALAYDISFTTRFQGEWPNAWKAFSRNIYLGSGYSSITLASDNDYLRALGETGLLGLSSFLLIFIFLGYGLKSSIYKTDNSSGKAFLFGAGGGLIGLFLNATLIDVFEASKVAESLWLLLGICAGLLALSTDKKLLSFKQVRSALVSKAAIFIYLFFLSMALFLQSIGNFFVSADYTLLRSVVSVSISKLGVFFAPTSSFFSPLSKFLIFFVYAFAAFQPDVYHVILILLHTFVAFGIYLIALLFFRNKFLSFISALLFLLFPLSSVHAFSLSTIGSTLCALFIVFSTYYFQRFRLNGSLFAYFSSIAVAVLALFSDHSCIVLILPIILIDLLNQKVFKKNANYYLYIPYLIISALALVFAKFTLSLNNSAYTYLLSGVIIIVFVYLLGIFFQKYINVRYKETILTLLFLVIAFLFYQQLEIQNKNWHQAGYIANRILSEIKLDYGNLNSSSNMYFVNLPTTYNGSGIFKEGFTDALWFIYQDDMPNIYLKKSLDDAKIQAQNTSSNYILEVSQNGEVKRVGN